MHLVKENVTKAARTGHLWTYGKNNGRLKNQINNSEIEHRTLCVNHTLTFFEFNDDDFLLRLVSFSNSEQLGLFSTFSEEVFDVVL